MVWWEMCVDSTEIYEKNERYFVVLGMMKLLIEKPDFLADWRKTETSFTRLTLSSTFSILWGKALLKVLTLMIGNFVLRRISDKNPSRRYF